MSQESMTQKDLKKLYQDIILHYNKHPYHFGEVEGMDYKKIGHNVTCGDKLLLAIQSPPSESKITKGGFHGDGCAIFKASASLMIQAIEGKSVEEAKEMVSLFKRFIQGETLSGEDRKILGKLEVFEQLAQYPARIKCGLLPWNTLESILDDMKEGAASDTQDSEIDVIDL